MLQKLKVLKREERVKDYIMPERIADYGGEWNNIESLLTVKDDQIALEEQDVAILNGNGYIILDMGKEIHGGLRILTHMMEGSCPIRLRFGESMSETCEDLLQTGKGTATNDHSLRDFNEELVLLSDMQFGSTGYRFVRIDFTANVVRLKSILGVFEHRDLKRIGSFECSDPVINEIFDIAGYTVELCMQHHLWDGIKRDRLVWIGDTHPELLTINALFGKDKCITEALDFCAKKAPVPSWINCMPTYSLWWLCIASDYYLFNDDTAYVESKRNYIEGLVNKFDELIDADGNFNLPEEDNSYFLDWQSAGHEERIGGVYALCSYTLEKCKLLYSALGNDESIIDNMLSRLKKPNDPCSFKQVNAFKVLAGFADAKEMLPHQTKGGAEGFSTFMSYYMLSSIAKAGATAEALDIMKTYYGAMLDLGATTFWEDFEMDWAKNAAPITRLASDGEVDVHASYGKHCYKNYRHSLCHGWSSGPVPFIMENILGIKVLAPGSKKISITPNLCNLEWATGTYPTPYGEVKVTLKKENGETTIEVTAPKEIEIIK